MTTHHDELRVAPDPSRAEELRQRLHARLAGVDQGFVAPIRSADTDPDDREGDLIMLETEDRPTGAQPPTPGRRSPGSWLLVAAVVAVVAIVGGLLITAAQDDEVQVPSEAPPAPKDMIAVQETGVAALEPGRYFIDPDGDATTPLRVTYEIAAEGWSPWIGTMKDPVPDHGRSSISITTVTNLAADACDGNAPLDPPVGPTVDDLATALSQLQPFQLSEAPTDVTLSGYQGKRLTLTVPADLVVNGTGEGRGFQGCTDRRLYSWVAPLLGGPFWGYNAAGMTEEFSILDVEGTRLVLVKLTSPDTPAQDLTERDAIFDSIVIEP